MQPLRRGDDISGTRFAQLPAELRGMLWDWYLPPPPEMPRSYNENTGERGDWDTEFWLVPRREGMLCNIKWHPAHGAFAYYNTYTNNAPMPDGYVQASWRDPKGRQRDFALRKCHRCQTIWLGSNEPYICPVCPRPLADPWKLAALQLRGPQSQEDLLLLYGLASGAIKMPKMDPRGHQRQGSV